MRDVMVERTTDSKLRKDGLSQDLDLQKLLQEGEANELARSRSATVEQKSVHKLCGFWTNFARKQKERREQQANSVQQNENKEVMSEDNCQRGSS